MPGYSEMTKAERFDEVDKLATEFFGTSRWKTRFARRYDLHVATLNKWRIDGAPLWACQALTDALTVKRLGEARQALSEALGHLPELDE